MRKLNKIIFFFFFEKITTTGNSSQLRSSIFYVKFICIITKWAFLFESRRKLSSLFPSPSKKTNICDRRYEKKGCGISENQFLNVRSLMVIWMCPLTWSNTRCLQIMSPERLKEVNGILKLEVGRQKVLKLGSWFGTNWGRIGSKPYRLKLVDFVVFHYTRCVRVSF